MTKQIDNFNIAAVILAGGDARRLGNIPKGKLKFPDGTSIIQRLIDQLETAGIDNVAISANDLTAYGEFEKQIVTDKRIGIGPLAGL